MFPPYLGNTGGVRSGSVCPGCGLDYGTISPPDAKLAIRSFPRRYRSALAAALEDETDAGLVRRRPDGTTWSALEYTAHVADLFEHFAEVVRRMHQETSPTIPFWDPDERAAAERYDEQDPRMVLDRLAAGAERLVLEIERVGPDGWERTATFPFGERDLLHMVRNAVHEGSHHLRDVASVLDRARGR